VRYHHVASYDDLLNLISNEERRAEPS